MSEQGAPDVGIQLRALRQERGLSLRTLAELCDLSPNTISLIERGESSPSVSTLHRLATALGVQITTFFEERVEPVQVVVTRAGERRRSGNAYLILESLGAGLEKQSIEPFWVTMKAGADSGPQMMVHGGQELVHCLEGEIEYEVDGQLYRLAGGDTLLFQAQLPHRWRNPGSQSANFLLIFCRGRGTQPTEQHLRAKT
jgi:transcriptional regulator with XRE-family HTH domain